MATFTPFKTFEQSLRATPSKQPPGGLPLKPEIHRGCTGKAHACGTIKTKPVILRSPDHDHHHHRPPVPTNSSHRKNSVSSETISDSGSENYSWNSNELNSNQKQDHRNDQVDNIVVRKKPLRPSLSSPAPRRRTIDAIIPTNYQTNGHKSPNHSDERNRLLSDGDKDCHDQDKRQASNFQRNRSFRASGGAGSKQNANGRPPWQNVYAANKGATIGGSPSPVGNSNGGGAVKRTGSFNARLRGSFRRKETVDWNAIWEKSHSIRCDGGNLKNYDKFLNVKVSPFLII